MTVAVCCLLSISCFVADIAGRSSSCSAFTVVRSVSCVTARGVYEPLSGIHVALHGRCDSSLNKTL